MSGVIGESEHGIQILAFLPALRDEAERNHYWLAGPGSGNARDPCESKSGPGCNAMSLLKMARVAHWPCPQFVQHPPGWPHLCRICAVMYDRVQCRLRNGVAVPLAHRSPDR